MKLRPRIFFVLLFGFSLLVLSPLSAQSLKSFDYTFAGSAEDSIRPPQSGIALMGGGKDQDDAFKWLIKQASYSDILVLRASGDGAYNPYILGLGPVNSVQTIVFNSPDAANDAFILEKINKAEGIFFPGGDQWKYVSLWKNTPVQKAIAEAIRRGAVIGGTSAGLAILGEFCFTAENDSILPEEALADPYHSRMCLAKGLFEFEILKNIITDSHFVKRDRMGRLISFIARLVEDGSTREAIGIGIDEQTTLLIGADGVGTLCGIGTAYILKTPGRPESCRKNEPLTFKNIQTYKMVPNSHFDFKKFEGSNLAQYSLSAESGKIRSSQNNGSIY
ncbi:MAG: cyanophycinase [Candidatus Ozemobacteraceae bacterium]